MTRSTYIPIFFANWIVGDGAMGLEMMIFANFRLWSLLYLPYVLGHP